MQSENKFKVAVYMITYNHESFIAKAIESVLEQETDFDYHLFIGEDCSTDNTSIICKDYAKKYANKITLFSQEQNIGANQNAQIIYKACFESGAKYIAMCEGDDYWTDPVKLHEQVYTLENNHNLSLSFHNTRIVKDDKIISSTKAISSFYRNNLIFNTKDLILFDNNICTSSMVFRTDAIKDIPFEVFNQTGEKSLQLILSLYGGLHYANKTFSVYRSHEQGISYNLSRFDLAKINLRLYNNLDHFTNYVFNSSIRKKKKRIILRLKYVGFLKSKPKYMLLFRLHLLLGLVRIKLGSFLRM